MVQTRSSVKKENIVADRNSDGIESPQNENAPVTAAETDANTSANRRATSTAQPRSKRVKARKNSVQTQGTSKRQSKRGKLVMFLEMNLDVLVQILSYLHPMDLLNLARLSRPFRQFLMSKPHAFVWVAAREQVDEVPECPPDMSEPEYANLLFDQHCHSCGGVVYTIYWHIRRMYCPGCRFTRLRVAEGCNGLPDTLGMLPSEYLIGVIDVRGGARFVDKQQYDAVYKEYHKTPIGKRDAFIARRREILTEREEHIRRCERWDYNVYNARMARLSDAKTTRNASIFARLESAGFGREIQHYGNDRIRACRYKLFRSSKRLTEKEWQAVYSELEPKMMELREERLKNRVFRPRRELLVKVYDRYVQDPAPEGGAVDLLPAVWDVTGFAPFNAIINQPEDDMIEETAFVELLDQIPALAKQWREEVDAQLASIVEKGLAPSRWKPSRKRTQLETSPKEYLHLACAVFEATGHFHSQLFTYPCILVESSDIFYRPYGHLYLDDARPWSLPKESYKSVQLFSGAADVVIACGLDPRSATVDDMDQVNARLICNECQDSTPEKVQVWNWKSAIFHAHRHHHDKAGFPGRWTLLDKNLIPEVEAREPLSPRKPFSRVFCALCQKRALPKKCTLDPESIEDYIFHVPLVLLDHLSGAHGIQDIEGSLQENVHYIVPDESKARRPVWMKTEDGVVSFGHEVISES